MQITFIGIGLFPRGFENECVRLSESLVYDEKNPKEIPLIKEIIILDCPGTSEKDEHSWHEILLKQNNQKFDIIFLDPPYTSGLAESGSKWYFLSSGLFSG